MLGISSNRTAQHSIVLYQSFVLIGLELNTLSAVPGVTRMYDTGTGQDRQVRQLPGWNEWRA